MTTATIAVTEKGSGRIHPVKVDTDDLERLQAHDWHWNPITKKAPYRLLTRSEKRTSSGKTQQSMPQFVLGWSLSVRGARVRVVNGDHTDMRKANLKGGPGQGDNNKRPRKTVRRATSIPTDAAVKPSTGELHITTEQRLVYVVTRRNRNGNMAEVYVGFDEEAAKEAAFEAMFPGSA